MTTISVDQLLTNGVHYGHRASRWNPKMRQFIHEKRNNIHIIDLRQTVRGLLRASNFLQHTVAEGGKVLWVGTKRSAKEAVRNVAQRTNHPFVTERWLGGTLTNFRTIRSRLGRLNELEALDADGTVALLSKKQQSRHRIEKKKILKNLEGIRDLEELPAVLVVVDPKHEHIAVAEARTKRIPVIGILDTDCDPDSVDIAIPGNDDAMRSVALLLSLMADGVDEGNKAWAVVLAEHQRVEAQKRQEEEQRREQDRQRRRVTEDWQRRLREEADRKRGGAPVATNEPEGAAPKTPAPDNPAPEAPAASNTPKEEGAAEQAKGDS